MTKEEILDSHSNDFIVSDKPQRAIPYNHAIQAMEQYAKQEAIEFGEFIKEMSGYEELTILRLRNISSSNPPIEELYEQFIQLKQ